MKEIIIFAKSPDEPVTDPSPRAEGIIADEEVFQDDLVER